MRRGIPIFPAPEPNHHHHHHHHHSARYNALPLIWYDLLLIGRSIGIAIRCSSYTHTQRRQASRVTRILIIQRK